MLAKFESDKNPSVISVGEFLAGAELTVFQLEDLSSQARAICEKKGQEIPKELWPILGLYYWTRTKYQKKFSMGREAMTEFCRMFEGLPAGETEKLKPWMILIQKGIPIPPVDLERVGRVLAIFSEGTNADAAGHPYTLNKS